MKKETKNKLAKMMVNNGIDWYALLMQDGTVSLRHATGLSSILQCGHSKEDYDIAEMYQCGYADTLEDAIEQIEQ